MPFPIPRRMHYYLDTEFIERPGYLELISLALVKETGESYYAVSAEFDESQADAWLHQNVIAQLEDKASRKSREVIARELSDFIGHQIPKIWAYYATFDWACILWLYGGLNKLPYNFPLYCRELRQEIDRLRFPNTNLPPKHKIHHALADAHWNCALHSRLIEYERSLI